MPIDTTKTGRQIAALRKAVFLTQNELGERLNVSFQAVSKWERGETLPDTSLLIDLAGVLQTTVDNILSGGARELSFKGSMAVGDIREGINCLERMGLLLGRQNIVYTCAIEGLSDKMNTDIAAMLSDDYLKECLIVEAVLSSMKQGYYFDMTDVKNGFKHDKWRNTVSEYAKKYGMV